jgi:hypothetical protein
MIELDISKIDFVDRNWIELAQDKLQYQTTLVKVMNLRVP